MSNALESVQNYVDIARRRYDSLADSERLIVNVIVVVVAIALVFLLLIAPAQQSVANAEMKLSAQQNLMQWMKDKEPLARQVGQGSTSKQTTDKPLATLITSTSSSAGITIKRFEPESDEKLRVWLEKVSFDKTVRWLDQLESRYGITITNISVDAEREQGLITAKLVLQK